MRSLLPIVGVLLLIAGCSPDQGTDKQTDKKPTSSYKQALDEAKATADALQGAMDQNDRRAQEQRQ